MRHFSSLITANFLTATFLVLSSNVFAIEVGSIAASRFESSWTLDGSSMVNSRAKLLNSANFGPGGTVGETINVTDVSGPITLTALSTFDIFFIGYLDDDNSNAFTADELQAFEDWVSVGGTMVITCDDTDYDDVCSHFGPTPSGAIDPPVGPTGVGVNHPIFDGPFGEPTTILMDGTQTSFENIGGFIELGEDEDGNPVVLEDLIGDGRVILFTDVDMISDYTLSDGAGISNDNDEFLGNIIAYLADEAVETFAINAGLNGNWWFGPDRSGEGAQLEVVISGGNLTLVANFYSYDPAGNQIFMVAFGQIIGNVANVDVYITEGPQWGAGFDADDVVESQWGTGTFTATSCNAVHMELNSNAQYEAMGYTDLAYQLKRLNVPAAPCPIANPD